jgi:hypothetical protein
LSNIIQEACCSGELWGGTIAFYLLATQVALLVPFSQLDFEKDKNVYFEEVSLSIISILDFINCESSFIY